jgi:hypothetical protein
MQDLRAGPVRFLRGFRRPLIGRWRAHFAAELQTLDESYPSTHANVFATRRKTAACLFAYFFSTSAIWSNAAVGRISEDPAVGGASKAHALCKHAYRAGH